MKIDATLIAPPTRIAEEARAIESAGYAAAWTAETNHDPFLALLAAAQATVELELGTSIAVAFARNPMTIAQLGWDLQSYSGGRATIGLGSQIKPHIERRYSMPWSSPAARMRDMIRAVRAIWSTWYDDTPLAFDGDFYTHTLMPANFIPDRSDLAGLPLPRILLAGVGPQMTDVAGEVADGFIVHPFTSTEYFTTVTLPRLAAARRRVEASLEDFTLMGSVMIATGTDSQSREESTRATRERIAFYASTPAYRGVLDMHGWGDLHERLYALSKEKKWEEMGRLIGDDLLQTFAIACPPEEVPAAVMARFGDSLTRISLTTLTRPEPEMWSRIVSELIALSRKEGAA